MRKSISTSTGTAESLSRIIIGKTVIETDVCAFSIAEDELEKCKKTYDGKEAYSFYFGKYQIRSLYADCLDYRKNMARDEVTPHATYAGTQQAGT